MTLTTGGENATLVNGFNVTAGTPRLTAVSPGFAQQGQSLNVTVAGLFTAFVNSTTTADFGAGIAVNSVSVTSATTATVSLSISPLAAVRQPHRDADHRGAVDLIAGYGSFFAVTPGNAAIGQVTPRPGRQAESLTVTITGANTHVASGSTIVSFGTDITVTSLLVTSPTSATANLSISPLATLGARAVTATTLGDTRRRRTRSR